jgi:ribosomal protein S18 acetylase RimI-like enzyme
MEIMRLREATEEAVRDIGVLISQLREHEVETTLSEMKAIVNDENSICIVARDGERIVGMASLYILQKFGKRIAHVEDVVVDDEYRGRGLGKSLMEAVIASARENDVSTLNLTSRPAREAANALYQKLGFEKNETNAYRMKLK